MRNIIDEVRPKADEAVAAVLRDYFAAVLNGEREAVPKLTKKSRETIEALHDDLMDYCFAEEANQNPARRALNIIEANLPAMGDLSIGVSEIGKVSMVLGDAKKPVVVPLHLRNTPETIGRVAKIDPDAGILLVAHTRPEQMDFADEAERDGADELPGIAEGEAETPPEAEAETPPEAEAETETDGAAQAESEADGYEPESNESESGETEPEVAEDLPFSDAEVAAEAAEESGDSDADPLPAGPEDGISGADEAEESTVSERYGGTAAQTAEPAPHTAGEADSKPHTAAQRPDGAIAEPPEPAPDATKRGQGGKNGAAKPAKSKAKRPAKRKAKANAPEL